MRETIFTLPLDWNAWRDEWASWKTRHLTQMMRVPSPFQGKNFLADEVLGVWKVNGRTVELSEVTFPSFERNPETGMLNNDNVRGIGVTFNDENTPGATVVHSFAELEEVLGL